MLLDLMLVVKKLMTKKINYIVCNIKDYLMFKFNLVLMAGLVCGLSLSAMEKKEGSPLKDQQFMRLEKMRKKFRNEVKMLGSFAGAITNDPNLPEAEKVQATDALKEKYKDRVEKCEQFEAAINVRRKILDDDKKA